MQRTNEAVEGAHGTLRDDGDRTVGTVRDPPFQAEAGRLPAHEIPETDALHDSVDGRFEPRLPPVFGHAASRPGCARGQRRSSTSNASSGFA